MLTVATLVVMVGIALLGFVGHTSSGALLLALITLRFATRNATKLSSKNNSELHTVGALFLLARARTRSWLLFDQFTRGAAGLQKMRYRAMVRCMAQSVNRADSLERDVLMVL